MTIEERAFEYAPGNTNLQNQCRISYIKGATEQKAIDDAEWRKDMAYIATKKQEWIDQACEWLTQRLAFGIHPSNGASVVTEFRNKMQE